MVLIDSSKSGSVKLALGACNAMLCIPSMHTFYPLDWVSSYRVICIDTKICRPRFWLNNVLIPTSVGSKLFQIACWARFAAIFFSSLSSCKCCIFLQFYLHFTTDYTCMIVYVTNNKEPWTLNLISCIYCLLSLIIHILCIISATHFSENWG